MILALRTNKAFLILPIRIEYLRAGGGQGGPAADGAGEDTARASAAFGRLRLKREPAASCECRGAVAGPVPGFAGIRADMTSDPRSAPRGVRPVRADVGHAAGSGAMAECGARSLYPRV